MKHIKLETRNETTSQTTIGLSKSAEGNYKGDSVLIVLSAT